MTDKETSTVNTIEVWSALVRTPDQRSATVSVHETRASCAEMLWVNYAEGNLDENDVEFPRPPVLEEDIDAWIRRLKSQLNIEIELESHILEV